MRLANGEPLLRGRAVEARISNLEFFWLYGECPLIHNSSCPFIGVASFMSESAIPNELIQMVRTRRAWPSWLLGIVVGGLGMQLILEDLSQNLPVRQLAATTLAGRPLPISASWAEMDAELASLPSGGNLLVQFTGFSADDLAGRFFAEFIYYRSVYLLYPRRVYLCPTDRAVNNGEQILAVRFKPDDIWLRGHDVRWVLRSRLALGDVTVDVLPAESAGGQERRP